MNFISLFLNALEEANDTYFEATSSCPTRKINKPEFQRFSSDLEGAGKNFFPRHLLLPHLFKFLWTFRVFKGVQNCLNIPK